MANATNTKANIDMARLCVDAEAISLFGGLSTTQIDQIWQRAEIRRVNSGDRVFEQGDMPTSINVLVSGRVEFVVEKNDVYTLEAYFEKGDTFGETGFIGIQPQAGSAIAVGPHAAEMMVFSSDSLLAIQQEFPELFSILMMNVAREASRKYHKKLLK